MRARTGDVMRMRAVLVMLATLLATSTPITGSGALGYFALIEKVVLEPSSEAAQRIQIWGAFAYVDCCGGIAKAERGYLYFRAPTPDEGAGPERIAVVRREWNDLKAVAGTGQAVGFMAWQGRNPFRVIRPDARSSASNGLYSVEFVPTDKNDIAARVRPASEKPESPAIYLTDSGIIKITPDGYRADIVKQLQEALKQ